MSLSLTFPCSFLALWMARWSRFILYISSPRPGKGHFPISFGFLYCFSLYFKATQLGTFIATVLATFPRLFQRVQLELCSYSPIQSVFGCLYLPWCLPIPLHLRPSSLIVSSCLKLILKNFLVCINLFLGRTFLVSDISMYFNFTLISERCLSWA